MIESFGSIVDGYRQASLDIRDWVLARAQSCFAEQADAKATIADIASYEVERTDKRERYLSLIGGVPTADGESLSLHETGRLDGGTYEIRKLVCESLPGCYFTANLYVPKGMDGPLPGVLMVCGHAEAGKAAPAYQRVCIRLVEAGFVVLIQDALSNGEMVQLVGADGKPKVGINTWEHSYLQRTASLVGQNIMRMFIRHAMRGLDVLSMLPEVDPERLGVTGNSGGGHLTQALMLVEPRVKAAFSCCSLTTRGHYLRSGARSYDGEQNVFGCIPAGLDYDDFLSAFAPRPVCLGIAGGDYFEVEGALAAVERARRVYGLFGADANLGVCLAPDEPHGYSTPLARGCVAWFARHLQGRAWESPAADPAVRDASDLQCTGSGQVVLEMPGARSVLDLHRDAWLAARESARAKPPLSRQDLRARLGIPADIPVPQFVRCTTRRVTEACIVERLFFFSEPGVAVTAVQYRPQGGATGGVVVVLPDGTEGQAAYAGQIQERVQKGQIVMVVDPRGLGAVRAHAAGGEGIGIRSREFRLANYHFLLGTSLASRRAFDILQALAVLRASPALPKDAAIGLAAFGWTSFYGLLAAAMDGNLSDCHFDGLPGSWDEAFGVPPVADDVLCEALILPEWAGGVDIPDLLRLRSKA